MSRTQRSVTSAEAAVKPAATNGRRSGEPRYEEIARWLREQAHQAAPGDRLPSESELARRFGVSRMTARQAVETLAREGFVERRPGAGTFVGSKPMHRHSGPLLSFTEDMRRRGKTPSSRLLVAELQTPSPADVEMLQLPSESRIVHIHRLRLADGISVALERAALPSRFAAVLAADLEEGSLHESLRALGLVPSRAQSWITARLATLSERRLLEIEAREPLLAERRLIVGADGEPLEHTESLYVASRYVIDATFSLQPTVPTAG